MAAFRLQPSELAALSDADKWTLLGEAQRIKARDRLDRAYDAMALGGDEDGRREYLRNLAAAAFYDDPQSHVIALEAITRRG